MVKNRKILTNILIVLIVIVSVMGIIFAVNSKQEMSGCKEPEDSIRLTPNNEADRQSYEDGEVKLNFQEKQQDVLFYHLQHHTSKYFFVYHILSFPYNDVLIFYHL